MPLVLRFINNYLTWEISADEEKWLQDDEIPADPLNDLRTKRNMLSVYLINDDKLDLERCISAYAATRNELHELNYLLFQEELVSEVGIKSRQSEGELVDKVVNRLHWDLYELSSQKLVELAKRILKNCEADSYDRNMISTLIKQSIANNWIEKKSLNSKILNQI